MPSMDSSLLALDRLNLNESDVISHLCSVAVEKCQDRAERRRAGCGGQAMRKRVLIKNFVAELIKKQQDMQLEEELEEGEEKRKDDDEGDEEDDGELNTSMVMEEEEDEEERDEDDENTVPTQVTRREWYHVSDEGNYGHHMPVPSSPSPPLDDYDGKSLWSLSGDPLLPSSPTSMALHLRDPYETRGSSSSSAVSSSALSDSVDPYHSSCDPYSAASSSSFFLSPPQDDDGCAPLAGSTAPWHDHPDGGYARPSSPTRGYSLYDDLYSAGVPSEGGLAISHYDLAAHLLEPSACGLPPPSASSPPSISSSSPVSSSPLHFLDEAELKTYSLLEPRGGEACGGRSSRSSSISSNSSSSSDGDEEEDEEDEEEGQAVLFDLSSPSSALSLGTPSKKRRSDESATSCGFSSGTEPKRLKL